jgi:hypothetical protein
VEQTVDKQRVNRVTVQLSGDGAAITLYRTNTRQGEVRNSDIGVPDFSKSGLPNKQVYVNYCRETMTNLLKNDGVPGFFYDPENHATNNELPRKFNKDLLVKHGYAILDDVLSAIHVPSVSHTIVENDDDIPCVTVEESYSDGFIKYGQTEFKVRFDHTSGANKQVVVPVSIKSGQLTKPKVMTIDGQQKNINSVNIMNLFQDQKPANTDKPIQSVVIARPTSSEPKVDMPKAPSNQEFEGDKPVPHRENIDPASDAAAEQAVNGASEQYATSESGTAIQDAISKMGTGKLTGEDIQKLREMVGGGKIDGTVGSIMNVLRGDKK